MVVAIDVGSSSVRAALVDSRGAIPHGRFVQVEYTSDHDAHGGVSIAFERLLALLVAAVDGLVVRSGNDLERVVAVGNSVFLHSLAPLGRDRRPIGPLLTWADTSSAVQAEGLRMELDEARLWDETGCPLHASYWPAKIVRLRDELGGTVRGWAGAPELLFRKLTGAPVVDASLASGSGLMDRRTGLPNETLRRALGLDRDSLAEVAPPFASRRLRGWAAARWPSLASVPWFAPWSDAWCGNVGLGASADGPAALQIGTSGALRAVVPDPAARLPAGLFGHRLGDGSGLVGGQLSEGGGVVAAVARLLGRSMRSLEAEARALEPDAHGLTILPFLAGERGPGYHASAHGVVEGLSVGSSAAEVYLAVLESIAYRFAALDALLSRALGRSPEIVAAGGALRESVLWQEIIAAALGRPILVAELGEASGRGAGILAMVGAGVVGSVADVPAPPSRIVGVDPLRAARYAAAAERSEALYRRFLGP